MEAIVEVFVERLSDRKTVDRVTEAWSGAIDRAIGRGVRRIAYSVALALVLFGAVKFELLSKLLKG